MSQQREIFHFSPFIYITNLQPGKLNHYPHLWGSLGGALSNPTSAVGYISIYLYGQCSYQTLHYIRTLKRALLKEVWLIKWQKSMANKASFCQTISFLRKKIYLYDKFLNVKFIQCAHFTCLML